MALQVVIRIAEELSSQSGACAGCRCYAVSEDW